MPKVRGKATARMKPDAGQVASMIVSAKTLPIDPGQDVAQQADRQHDQDHQLDAGGAAPPRDAQAAEPRQQQAGEHGQGLGAALGPRVEVRDLVGTLRMAPARADAPPAGCGNTTAAPSSWRSRRGGPPGAAGPSPASPARLISTTARAPTGRADGARSPRPPLRRLGVGPDPTRSNGFDRPQAASSSSSRRRILRAPARTDRRIRRDAAGRGRRRAPARPAGSTPISAAVAAAISAETTARRPGPGRRARRAGS